MQNKLLYLVRLFTVLLFLFVIHGFAAELYSQVILNDNRTKEILFSQQFDRERQSGPVISLKNYSNILSSELIIIENEWLSASEGQNSISYSFSRNTDGYVSPGRISIEGIDEIIENAFSLTNSSPESFGELNISTDFLVRDSESRSEISLVLMIKKPNGQWMDAGRGVFFPDADEKEQSFSIQISVSDIFIQKEETLDLMWVNRSPGGELHQLFTHRIEIAPEYSDVHPYRSGGLLITEVMPMGDVDGYQFEYLELYNPDDFKKSLKGVTIETDYGSHTIQSDAAIPPYGYYVLSNADFSDVENVENSYFYPGIRLFSDSEPNGRVEIKQIGEVIASAVYESAEVNISFEAERMSQSVDGYTGLQNMRRSSNSFMAEVNGSPGINGNSLPVYHKSFSETGLYLITLPGRFYSNILRLQDAAFYSVDGDPLQPAEVEPFQPVFMLKSGNEPITLSVESESASENSTIRTYETESHRYISPVKPGMYSIRELFDDRNLQSQPVAGVWDNISNRVEMVNTDQRITELWSPVIFNRSDNDELVNNRPRTEIPFNAENSFTFSLFEIQNDDEFLLDEVWVEVNDENNLSSTDQKPSYFIKPLFYLPGLNTDQKSPGTILYGNSSEIDESGFSYFKLKSERNTYSEFSLGTFNAGATEQRNGVLRWNTPENIPEDWSIMLTDRVTGQETDMRLEDHYRFRMQAESEKIRDDNTSQKLIQTVDINSGERERFSIKFEPPNLTAGSEEDTETPGSIELRQNYPNPFNPSTNITFFLPEDRQVRLGIYNIVGQQVATLIDDNIGAGEHSVVWNASNNPSGIYIVQLETGSRILTRKITLVK